MEQGGREAAHRAEPAAYLLFTDADIRHAPGSVRRLVAESVAWRLDLNSRMARLRCVSAAERLLIPPFLFFFNLLYPMRLANDPRRKLAAGAGGCVLVRRDALARAGGMAAIRGEVIDDVNLARAVKQAPRQDPALAEPGGRREHPRVPIRGSDLANGAALRLRPAWVLVAAAARDARRPRAHVRRAARADDRRSRPRRRRPRSPAERRSAVALLAAAAWAVSAAVYLPTVRYFGLPRAWVLTLPLGGLLYGGMTADSARQHLLGRDRAWS